MTAYVGDAVGFDRRLVSTRGTRRARIAATGGGAAVACVGLVALLFSVWPSTAGSTIPPEGSSAVMASPAATGPNAGPAVFDSTPAPHGEADPEAHPLARPVVVLYGDSLSSEARDAFAFAVGLADRPAVQVEMRTLGGLAICDVLELMANDAALINPGAVVIQFSGNALTPCMSGPGGSALTAAAYFERYEADAEAAVAVFAGSDTQVVLAGSPLSNNDQGDYQGGFLNAIYQRVARDHDGVRYVDAGAAVLDDGAWTRTLPCLPAEPCTGGVDAAGTPVNVVRAPDGGHFCPASPEAIRGVTDACPVWSSGAFRFGAAMAAPVVASLDAG